MKQKIAILHHDIEPPEIKFKEIFENKGFGVDLIDIRKTSKRELLDYSLIMNRVYSSVASRDFKMLRKTENLLKNLEKEGKTCINSSKVSSIDYSKFKMFKELSRLGIPTPKTLFVKSSERIQEVSEKAVRKLGLPIVIKRDCGGKSYDVSKVNSLNELVTSLRDKFEVSKEQNYAGGFILQKFIVSNRDHDCRVGFVEGEFAFSYGRSFVSRDSDEKWIASTSGGSMEFDYSAGADEINVARMANLGLNISFSESDVIMTNDGPCIIEVNISPGYFIDSIEDLRRMETIVERILSKYFSLRSEGIEIPMISEVN